MKNNMATAYNHFVEGIKEITNAGTKIYSCSSISRLNDMIEYSKEFGDRENKTKAVSQPMIKPIPGKPMIKASSLLRRPYGR